MAGSMRRQRTGPQPRLPQPQRMKRLAAADRERQIIDGAIRFFAEFGFAGQTRELAERVGITQPLLYRYFATKQALIERVFDEVFLKRMDPHWGELIADRSRPLEERLVEFYAAYSRATYTYEWIRIYMFSALMGNDLNRRYIDIVESAILRPMCNEIRHYCGLPGAEVIPISEVELEHVWVMHGGLFYYAVRKYIYHSRVAEDFLAVAKRAVVAMLKGVRAISAR
jgi:AcrR family transcriptional regulator